MELAFPVESFLQIKEEVISNRKDLEKEQSLWLSVRRSIKEEDVNQLDEQFKSTFEELGQLFLNADLTGLENILASLQTLVQKGASAKLLGNDELGTYNLARLIKHIAMITNSSSLELTCKIIRITIVAGADLKAQKAYAGNGGSISIEWICLYLAVGIGREYYTLNPDQYECYYRIFCWIIEDQQEIDTDNPFSVFLINLREAPEVLDIQEKIMLRMIYLKLSPFPHGKLSWFNRINLKWISILFPYENDYIKPYLKVVKKDLNEEAVKGLINSCTSSNAGRKYFKTYFSLHPHWLLEFIIQSLPATIFDLVRRNEKDLLIPFLKHFKSAMINLKDENGNTLLHQAVAGRGLMENIIQLLLQTKLSPHTINNDGLTPLGIALKNNKTDLIRLLTN